MPSKIAQCVVFQVLHFLIFSELERHIKNWTSLCGVIHSPGFLITH